MAMTARPIREESRIKRASCSRIGIRIVYAPCLLARPAVGCRQSSCSSFQGSNAGRGWKLLLAAQCQRCGPRESVESAGVELEAHIRPYYQCRPKLPNHMAWVAKDEVWCKSGLRVEGSERVSLAKRLEECGRRGCAPNKQPTTPSTFPTNPRAGDEK